MFAGVQKPKIGLVWKGRSFDGGVLSLSVSKRRNFRWRRWRLFWIGTARLTAFNSARAEEIAALGLQDKITDIMGGVRGHADTAALELANLDLVISVVIRLLVQPWRALWGSLLGYSRAMMRWRWLQNKATNPWYPTARVFGQLAGRDWASVIAEFARRRQIRLIAHDGNAELHYFRR